MSETEEQHEEKRIVYEELKDGVWIPRKTFEVRSDPWIYHQMKFLSGNVNHRNIRAQKRTVTTTFGPWEEVKPVRQKSDIGHAPTEESGEDYGRSSEIRPRSSCS